MITRKLQPAVAQKSQKLRVTVEFFGKHQSTELGALIFIAWNWIMRRLQSFWEVSGMPRNLNCKYAISLPSFKVQYKYNVIRAISECEESFFSLT